MSGRHATRAEAAAQPKTPAAGLLQRKCDCGTHAHGAAQCPACAARGPGREARQSLRIGPPGDRYEREADRVADQIMRSPLPGAGGDRAPSSPLARQPISTLDGGRQIQRAVEIQPDVTAALDILGQFNSLCPSGNFGVDQYNRITADCRESSPVCDCLCEVATDDTPYVIEVHNVTNNPSSQRLHDGTTETIPMPSVGPHTDLRGSAPTVHMASSTGSALAFGAFRPDGTPFLYENSRILVHELCSHARFRHSYSGTKGDRQGHDVTIGVENALCAPPVRGTYSDPFQGESFHQLPVSSARKAFALVDGWYYQHVP